jgi:hypothetical protein
MLPNPVADAASLLSMDTLRIIGGSNVSPTTTILRGPIDDTGALSVSFTADTPLQSARSGAAAVSITGGNTGPRVHVIGGVGPSGALASIETWQVDGSNLTFVTQQTPTMNFSARSHARPLVLYGNLFLIGGRSDTGPIGLVTQMLIDIPTATLQDPLSAGAMLRHPRDEPVVFSVGDRIYVAGGLDDTNHIRQDIDVANVDPASGSLGMFDVDPNGVVLSTPRRGASAVELGNYVYVFGGVDDQGNALNTVERAEIH